VPLIPIGWLAAIMGAIVLVAAAGAGVVGYRVGASSCASAKVAGAQTAVRRISRTVANDASVVERQQRDEDARRGTFGGVRDALNDSLMARPDAAGRECLDADLLRVVNSVRGGRPAVPADAHQGVPSAAPAAGRDGDDGREGADR
jgi:hypothetical protein